MAATIHPVECGHQSPQITNRSHWRLDRFSALRSQRLPHVQQRGRVSVVSLLHMILDITFVATLCFAAPAIAAEFYVSSSGQDSNLGTTTESPWASLAPLHQQNLAPGDRVLLRGGDVFEGPLLFDTQDRGTVANPIVVTAYGSGRATIQAGIGAGIAVHNTAGIVISDINVVGNGRTSNETDGVSFYVDASGDFQHEGITLSHMAVHGFGRNGIAIGSWQGVRGFRDVRIEEVEAHDNGLSGIATYADVPQAHELFYIGHARAYRNSGLPGTKPSGSGIVLGGVRNGVVEWSQAFDNGWLGDGGGGIWTYASSHILLQHNESFRNRTGGYSDGGGFDFDGGVTDSIMQYNFSHDNDGAGILLCQYAGASPWLRNTVRHNLSIDDGRKNSYAGILVWNDGSGLDHAEIRDNHIIISTSDRGSPSILQIRSAGTRHFSIHDNVMIVLGSPRLFDIAPGQEDLTLYANTCWPNNCLLDSPPPH